MIKAEPPPTEPPGAMPAEKESLPGRAGPSNAAEDSAATPVTETDYTSAEEITETAPPAWKAMIDPTIAAAAPPRGAIRLKGGSGKFFEKTDALVLPWGQSMEAVITYIDAPPAEEPTVRAERADLRAGSAGGVVVMPGQSVPMDVSADGKRMLGRVNGFMPGTMARLDVWTLNPGATPPKQLVSFKPYGKESWSRRDTTWSRFIGNDNVLTLSSDGWLVMWELPAAKPVWRRKMESRSSPVLSPGRTFLALRSEDRIELLDAKKGTTLGQLEGSSNYVRQIEFRSDGKELAALLADSVRVWDLATGKVVHDVLIPHGANARSIVWAGENSILVGGHLLDLDRRVIVWTYDGINEDADGDLRGNVVFVTGDAKAKSLTSAALPHEAAQKAAAGLNMDALMLIKPGVKVSVEVNIDASEEIRQKVLASLKERLQQNGAIVADGQPIKLSATTSTEQKGSQTYRDLRTGETVDVNQAQKVTRLSFENEGKTVWTAASTSGTSSFLHPKEGQSAQQAADAGVQYQTDFLVNCTIPKYVPTPKEPLGYGRSSLSAQGLKDVAQSAAAKTN